MKVNYRIVDPEVEAANKRMEAMRKGFRYEQNSLLSKATEATHSVPRQIRSMEAATRTRRPVTTISTDRSEESLVDPLPPTLMETINLSAGVMLREGALFF